MFIIHLQHRHFRHGRHRCGDASWEFHGQATTVFGLPGCFEHSNDNSDGLVCDHRFSRICSLWWRGWGQHHIESTKRSNVSFFHRWQKKIKNNWKKISFSVHAFAEWAKWHKYWLRLPFSWHLACNFSCRWTFYGANWHRAFRKKSTTFRRLHCVRAAFWLWELLRRPYPNSTHSLVWLGRFSSHSLVSLAQCAYLFAYSIDQSFQFVYLFPGLFVPAAVETIFRYPDNLGVCNIVLIKNVFLMIFSILALATGSLVSIQEIASIYA